MSEEIADWLRDRRQVMRLSIREFAKLAKIPHTTIANIEKGIKPSINVLKKLAAFLKVDEARLFVMAGVLESEKRTEVSIAQEMDGLPKQIQEEILEYAKFKRKQFEESKRKR